MAVRRYSLEETIDIAKLSLELGVYANGVIVAYGDIPEDLFERMRHYVDVFKPVLESFQRGYRGEGCLCGELTRGLEILERQDDDADNSSSSDTSFSSKD